MPIHMAHRSSAFELYHQAFENSQDIALGLLCWKGAARIVAMMYYAKIVAAKYWQHGFRQFAASQGGLDNELGTNTPQYICTIISAVAWVDFSTHVPRQTD